MYRICISFIFYWLCCLYVYLVLYILYIYYYRVVIALYLIKSMYICRGTHHQNHFCTIFLCSLKGRRLLPDCGSCVNSAVPGWCLLFCTVHHGKSDTRCLRHSATHTTISVKTGSSSCSFFVTQENMSIFYHTSAEHLKSCVKGALIHFRESNQSWLLNDSLPFFCNILICDCCSLLIEWNWSLNLTLFLNEQNSIMLHSIFIFNI